MESIPFRLIRPTDREALSRAEAIAAASEGAVSADSIYIHPSLPSTNAAMKEAASGCALPACTLVIADTQTAGRGRLGRSFYSPKDTGLYMSLYLHAKDAGEALPYTCIAATAVCRSIRELSGDRVMIKWVNDLYLNDRKICGILCEKTTGGIVVGIGLNLREPEGGFPEELRSVAGALNGGLSRELLCGRILRGIRDYDSDRKRSYNDYCRWMLLTGRTVLWQGIPVLVTGVEPDFSLRVRLPDGSTTLLFSGEVSFHGIGIDSSESQ